MFTGIVETIGTVEQVTAGVDGAQLVVTHALGRLTVGESVSVDGCCLTVTGSDDTQFTADLMGETLDRTGLGALVAGAPVNLERALAAGDRLGGHLVQGHVDGVGAVVTRARHDAWTDVTFRAPVQLAPYLVEKGSITVDGVSLTVTAVSAADAEPFTFSVGLIPHTLTVTVLGDRTVGDTVNLEVDVIAKYVRRMLGAGTATPYDAPAHGQPRKVTQS